MLEIFGVLTGLLYIILEIKQHRAMWVVGFITSLVYVFVFFASKIYADMGLNIYYVLISLYGFWQWSRKTGDIHREEKTADEIIVYRHLTVQLSAGIFLSFLCLFASIWYILAHFTDSPIPVGDAFITSTGIVATWMLARCIIEHWVFWIISNGVSVYLYYLRELYPTMFLYICYALLPIYGYYIWKKKGQKVNDTPV